MSVAGSDIREKVLDTLRGVLAADNSLSRCWAVRASSRLGVGDPETIQQLIGLLRDPDPDVRMDTAAALGELRAQEAADRLLESVASDPEGDVRIQAVGALARIRCKESVDALIECVRNDGYAELDLNADDFQFSASWEVQSQAMAALGEIGDPKATAAIMNLLAEEEYLDLRESGFRILAKLNTPEARAWLLQKIKAADRRTRRWAVLAIAALPDYDPAAGKTIPAEILGGLVAALMDKEPGVRMAAARVLKGVSSPLVTVPIAMLLQDPEKEVRDEIIDVLGQARGADVLEHLHKLAADSEPKLQRRIAVVLGEIGDPSSFELLSGLLGGDDENLNYAVAHSLGQLGVPGTENRLTELLASNTTPVPVRIQAAQALGKTLQNLPAEAAAVDSQQDAPDVQDSKDNTGAEAEPEVRYDPEAALCNAVSDPVEALGLASLQALAGAWPEKIVERLIALLDGRFVRVAGDGAIRSKEEVSVKVDEATEESDAESANAAALAAAIGDKGPASSTLASIVAGLPGETLSVEASGADGSGNSPDSQEIEVAQPEPDRTALRVAAATMLAEFADPGTAAIRALRRAFDTGNPAIRQAALRTLIEIGGDEVKVVVQDALQDEAIEVRLAALERIEDYIVPADLPGLLAELIADPEPYVRARTVSVLGKTDATPELSALICAALQDESIDVCRAALGALSEENCTDECVGQIYSLMFRFSAELRHEAAKSLRRSRDTTCTLRLLGSLQDQAQEEIHWICIDALADIHAADSASVN